MVAKNLAKIKANIAHAAEQDGRHADDVTLVAVSKQQSESRIDSALEAGVRVFGENRVQEAQKHWQDRRLIYDDLCLHLIGPLQTNKSADAVALFDVIETLDREKLAASLAAEMQKQSLNRSCYVQVNTGNEDQKAGITPDETQGFVELCRQKYGINITGLMCIPPIDEEPAMHFALLKNLAEQADIKNLSMGMSNDYEIAIRFGATHIRVGSGLFGARSS